jgi:phosphate transport system substrate-binding protein
MEKYPGVKINVAGGGSGAGIKAAQQGTADIGASSRELKDTEKGTVKETVIAKDGIAVIVHPDNPVENISMDQIKGVFTGKITNWKDLGGKDAAITVIIREAGSGTRGAFQELTIGEDAEFTDKAIIQNSNGALRTAVAGNPDAIGFISFGYINNEIKPLKVEGVEATKDNVLSGSYKISRPFLYLTKAEPQGLVKAYIDFVLSPEGQSIVGKEYIPVK